MAWVAKYIDFTTVRFYFCYYKIVKNQDCVFLKCPLNDLNLQNKCITLVKQTASVSQRDYRGCACTCLCGRALVGISLACPAVFRKLGLVF